MPSNAPFARAYRSPTYYELETPPELDWRPYRPESWRDYRREWERRGRDRDPGPFPLHLDIDPTNACNLQCPMCPRTYYLKTGRTAWNPSGQTGFMDFSFYRNLIEQAVEGGARSVKLNFLGEPLLHPKLCEMVALAAQNGLWVMINTNAVLLTESYSRKLLAAGLTDIFFSFDSPYPEAYQAIRAGARFKSVLGHIKTFMRLKDEAGQKHIQTRASMVLNPEDPQPEKTQADYTRLFRDLGVAEIGFGRPTVMGFDYPGHYGLRPAFTCPDIYRRLFIFWDGGVNPCCGEWERRLELGSAQAFPLARLWAGAPLSDLRALHDQGRYFDHPVCRACSVPYLAGQ